MKITLCIRENITQGMYKGEHYSGYEYYVVYTGEHYPGYRMRNNLCNRIITVSYGGDGSRTLCRWCFCLLLPAEGGIRLGGNGLKKRIFQRAARRSDAITIAL